MAGAWTFASVENYVERADQLLKVEKIETIYRQISAEMSTECNVIEKESKRLFNEQLYKSLSMFVYFFVMHTLNSNISFYYKPNFFIFITKTCCLFCLN